MKPDAVSVVKMEMADLHTYGCLGFLYLDIIRTFASICRIMHRGALSIIALLEGEQPPGNPCHVSVAPCSHRHMYLCAAGRYESHPSQLGTHHTLAPALQWHVPEIRYPPRIDVLDGRPKIGRALAYFRARVLSRPTIRRW